MWAQISRICVFLIVFQTERRKIEIHQDHSKDLFAEDTLHPQKRTRRMSIGTFKSNIANLRAASGHDHQNEEFEVYRWVIFSHFWSQQTTRKISRALSVHLSVMDDIYQAWESLCEQVSTTYHSVFTPRGSLVLPEMFPNSTNSSWFRSWKNKINISWQRYSAKRSWSKKFW